MIGSTRNIRILSNPLHVLTAMVLLLAVDVSARLLPHDPNATPLGASALFAGFLMNRRWTAVLVPIMSLLISDFIIGMYDWRIMLVVYASLTLPALVGRLGRANALILGGLALGSSLLFFLATNFAVWFFSGMYAANLGGLLQCYLAAWPFFKSTLRGDLFWTTSFVAAYILVQAALTKQLKRQLDARSASNHLGITI